MHRKLRRLQSLFVYTLIFSIVFSSWPVYSQILPTTILPNQVESQEPVAEFETPEPDEKVQELEMAISGKPGCAYLDTFCVLDNELINEINPNKIDLRALSVSSFQRNQLQILADVRVQKFHKSQTPFDFDITYQGLRLYHVRTPVVAVGFEGSYLYFVPANGSNQIYFFDLKFLKSSLGDTNLAVFRIPFKEAVTAESVRFDGDLIVNNERVSSKGFEVYSGLQQMGFNATANLSSLEFIEDSREVVDQLGDFFDRSMELVGDNLNERLLSTAQKQEHLQDFVSQFQAQLTQRLNAQVGPLKQKAQNVPERTEETEIQKEIKKTFDVPEMEASITENLVNQRKLLNRISMLWAGLRMSQPTSIDSILKSFGRVVGAMKKRNLSESGNALLDLVRNQSLRTKVVIASGVVVGAVYPESVGHAAFQALDIGATVLQSMVGTGRDLILLGFESIKVTASGFNPFHFYAAYFSPERLPKFTIGLTAIMGTLYVVLGIPYIVTNLVLLTKDLVKIDYPRVRARGDNFLRSLMVAFIERQRRDKKEHLDTLAKAESLKNGGLREAFSQEEDLEAQRFADELVAQNSNQNVERLKEKIVDIFGCLDGIRHSTVETLRSWSLTSRLFGLADKYQLDEFRKALTHFLFSLSSLTHAGVAYINIWQGWFAIRSFVWSPSITALSLSYSNYFKISKQGYIASPLNGGNRTRSKNIFYRIVQRDYLKELEKWEDQLLSVEGEIYKHALDRALNATARFSGDHGELRQIYSRNHKSVSDVEGLSLGSRTFFRSYYYELVSRSIQSHLENVAQENQIVGSESRDNTRTLIQLKEDLLHTEISIDAKEAERIVKAQSDAELFANATRRANDVLNPSNIVLNQKFRLLKMLDPDYNAPVFRMAQVEKQLKNPLAIARAMNAMLASNLVDKPMELLIGFACLAGITEGVLMPIQDEMFGPNSWFHLSRMAILNGFVYGVISGVLADPWMKLQVDLLHEGKFGEVPRGELAKKSYLNFFRTKFTDKSNSFRENQRHNMKIVWGNMKAAATTVIILNLLTLYRVDIDSYIAGYFITFFSPLIGIASKLEQSFELSSYYWLKDIPKRFHSHPTVVGAYRTVLAKKRIWFNVYYKLYENVIGYLAGNFELMNTHQFGSRSFLRILFGGATPTEHLNGASNFIQEKVAEHPVAVKAIQSCTKIFTNKYTDWR